ncbi:MAG: GNAT family N-acetyltransferase [Rhodospirillales bacterium]|nr:GNAT family N-acetyltransferase [Rhodospirillales bacterium]
MLDELEITAERCEREALGDFHAATPEAVKIALGMKTHTVGGAFVSVATHDPSILLNRTIGLGVEAPAAREDIAAIRKIYGDAGVGRFFLHLNPGAEPEDLSGWLAAAGMRPHRRWMKFRRGLTPPPEKNTYLRIEKIGPDFGHDFGAIAAQGFGLTDLAVPALAALAARPGWHVYMSFAGDDPAGVGAMFVSGGCAWFDWAATLPAYRRQGSQSAILRRRINEAIRLGCKHMFTETGEAAEGDPQHSYHNIEKAGFQAWHPRDNFIPAD